MKDQTLTKGNLGLKRNCDTRTPVRVLRGVREARGARGDSVAYVYEGLYSVDRCFQEPSAAGPLVWKFELRRIEGASKARRGDMGLRSLRAPTLL